jgi:hypothetical protein
MGLDDSSYKKMKLRHRNRMGARTRPDLRSSWVGKCHPKGKYKGRAMRKWREKPVCCLGERCESRRWIVVCVHLMWLPVWLLTVSMYVPW